MQIGLLLGFIVLTVVNALVLVQLLRQRQQLFGIEKLFSTKVEHNAELKLMTVLDQVAMSFSDELNSVTTTATAELDDKLKVMIDQSITQYERQIVQAREEVLQQLTLNRTNIETTQSRAEQEVDAAVEQLKQEALNRIETKLNAILSSYLLKSLGPVDWSAQQDYIFQTLNANRETLRRDIRDVR